MKNIILLLAATIVSGSLFPQNTVIPTKNGRIAIYPVLHSSMIIQWNGKTIYSDPYGGPEMYKVYADPDLVLITHTHQDHLDSATLKGINTLNAELIAPQTVIDKLGNIKFKKITVLGNGNSITREGIKIEAVPMYNLNDEDPFHSKGDGNGYILNMDDKRVYIAGDTEGIPEMRQLQNIDMAFIPMNLPYTMDVEQAADAVLDFKPKVVIPFHYRGAENKFSDVEKFKELVKKGDESIEVRLLNWYPEQKKSK